MIEGKDFDSASTSEFWMDDVTCQTPIANFSETIFYRFVSDSSSSENLSTVNGPYFKESMWSEFKSIPHLSQSHLLCSIRQQLYFALEGATLKKA